MTFDDILDQVITLLKRQGRVSYGAMKRRFDLDDAYLEDLKGEILFAYPVVDEDGRGLVWTGVPLLTTPPLPDAARRQLTVMFCDVVDSTNGAGHAPQAGRGEDRQGGRGGNGLRKAGGPTRRCYNADSRYKTADDRGSTRRTTVRRKSVYG
jgi:hypothetical protein